jgi:CubicO group peptidase (beta-lactamase class C family)
LDGEKFGSDVERLNQALASRQAGSMLDLACSLPRAHPQGAVFNYSTIDSGVLGALVAAATGRPLADYGAEMIWGPAGMEADARWLLESEGGLEWGGFGVSARLRDVGRFGQLVLEDGEVSGRRVLPPGWRDLAGQPDCAPNACGRLMPNNTLGYGYQWWVLPHGPTGIHRGAFVAIGIFGQYIYVHPSEQVVVAIQSAWRQHHETDAVFETFALFGAAVRALRPDPAEGRQPTLGASQSERPLHHCSLRSAPPSTSAMRRLTAAWASSGRASAANRRCSRISKPDLGACAWCQSRTTNRAT